MPRLRCIPLPINYIVFPLFLDKKWSKSQGQTIAPPFGRPRTADPNRKVVPLLSRRSRSKRLLPGYCTFPTALLFYGRYCSWKKDPLRKKEARPTGTGRLRVIGGAAVLQFMPRAYGSLFCIMLLYCELKFAGAGWPRRCLLLFG